jgi:hypothetical protein
VLGESDMGFKEKEVSPSLDSVTMIGGVGKSKVGQTYNLLGQNHLTISGEIRVSKLYPSN